MINEGKATSGSDACIIYFKKPGNRIEYWRYSKKWKFLQGKLELGYTFIQHTWYVPLGQYSQFCSWKTKDWWCPDWPIWVRFCCVHQNSSKRVTGSGADSSNTYASVTGLCVISGSSELGWTQAQACCLWLRRGGHKRSSHNPQTHWKPQLERGACHI